MDLIALALAQINAPRPTLIDRATLLAGLRSHKPIPGWAPHIRAFLEELPIELVHDIVLDGIITFEELAAAARVWGCINADTTAWITEMATLSLANASRPSPRSALGTAG